MSKIFFNPPPVPGFPVPEKRCEGLPFNVKNTEQWYRKGDPSLVEDPDSPETIRRKQAEDAELNRLIEEFVKIQSPRRIE